MMKVDDISSLRFQSALQFLRDGIPFTFDNVRFWLDRTSKQLVITAPSRWDALSNLTNRSAIADIERGRKIFEFLASESPEFAEIVEGYSPRVSLIHDAGTSEIELANMIGGEIIWAVTPPSR